MIRTFSPRRTDSKISVERVGEETLVYDEVRHRAFCLNQTSSVVWRMCDGATTPAQIATAATVELVEPITEELVLFALNQLECDGLIQPPPPSSLPPLLSRRAMVEKLGVRALALLPLVAVVMVPQAAEAFSGTVTGSRPSSSQFRLRQSLMDQQATSAPKNKNGSDSSEP